MHKTDVVQNPPTQPPHHSYLFLLKLESIAKFSFIPIIHSVYRQLNNAQIIHKIIHCMHVKVYTHFPLTQLFVNKPIFNA